MQWFLFLQFVAKVRGMFSFDTKREPEKCIALRGVTFCLFSACKDAPLGQRQGGVFRFPPPYLWTPPTPQRNNCDRRQRRKQGAVVGAAASKTRVPPKARSGCWVPQPGSSGGHSKSSCFKESCCKMASLRRQLRGTWRCCRAMDFLRHLRLFGEKNCCGFDFLAVFM